MMALRSAKIFSSLAAIDAPDFNLMAPFTWQTSFRSAVSSTTPKPVYSLPQSIPRTRIEESVPQIRRIGDWKGEFTAEALSRGENQNLPRRHRGTEKTKNLRRRHRG